MITHLKSKWFLLRFISFVITSLLLITFYKTITYNATIDTAMDKVNTMLLTNRALSEFISQEQKPEIARLQENDHISHDYFNPKLLSGSYITKRIHDYYNHEKEKGGEETHLFKFSSDNAFNPKNRADTLELKILNQMRNGDIKEHKEVIKKEGITYLYYAKPLRRVSPKCLQCHSSVEEAPSQLVERYGTKSGFNYKLGSLTGMNSIYTPISKELDYGNKMFYYLSSITILVLFGIFILTEFMFYQISKKRDAELKSRSLEVELEYQNITLQKSLEIISKHIMLSRTDLEGNITEVSDALCVISGYTKNELLGKPHSIIRHPDTDSKTFHSMWERIQNGKTWQGEIKNRKKDGSSFWVDIVVTPDFDEDKKIVSYSSFWHDATHKKRMELMSITDTLTGLYNRRHFKEVFQKELPRARRDKNYFVFIKIDLDFFKRYNDTYGHQAGDEALQRVSQVMQETFKRPGDFCFRLGGEEFGVTYATEKEIFAFEMAQKLCLSIESLKIAHKNSKICSHLTASIGISIVEYRDELIDMDLIVSRADDALYRAKEKGRNSVSE